MKKSMADVCGVAVAPAEGPRKQEASCPPQVDLISFCAPTSDGRFLPFHLVATRCWSSGAERLGAPCPQKLADYDLNPLDLLKPSPKNPSAGKVRSGGTIGDSIKDPSGTNPDQVAEDARERFSFSTTTAKNFRHLTLSNSNAASMRMPRAEAKKTKQTAAAIFFPPTTKAHVHGSSLNIGGALCEPLFNAHVQFVFQPRPERTDGEASHPGPGATHRFGKHVEAHTDTQKMVLKSIRHAEAEGDGDRAEFLRKFWRVNELDHFFEAAISVGDVGLHVCIDLAAAASAASHRSSNHHQKPRVFYCFRIPRRPLRARRIQRGSV